MASVVDICNRALQRLGANRIADLSDDSRAARSCNVAYEPVRDALLRRHPWNFALGRAQLAASTTAPAFGPAYQYPLPSDFIRLLPDINDTVGTGGTNGQDDWVIEGGAILTDESGPLNIRYIRKITDPNAMDPLFREALSKQMAMEMCEDITQSNQKVQLIKDELKDILAEARRNNAFEQNSSDTPEDTWITARL